LSDAHTPKRNFAVRVGAAPGRATPLVFFHGDWTAGGFYVGHLARKLGPGFSLIAVAAHGGADDPIPASIEAMAADRLPAILQAQPSGPYRLAGHCVGGIVALETARLLMAAHQEVEAVAMIDPPLTADGRSLRPAPAVVSNGLCVAPSPDIPAIPADFEDDSHTTERYLLCLSKYALTPLPVRLLILSAEFDGRPWRELSANAELVEGGGAHFDWVTHRIDELAARLSKFAGPQR
jgi:pimeloyl-ACP methyl ester carboxylesterase